MTELGQELSQKSSQIHKTGFYAPSVQVCKANIKAEIILVSLMRHVKLVFVLRLHRSEPSIGLQLLCTFWVSVASPNTLTETLKMRGLTLRA